MANAAQNKTAENLFIKGLFCAKYTATWQIQSHSDCPAAPNPILFSVLNVRTFLKYWLPPLVWLAVIFLASGDTKSFEHSSRILAPLLRWLFPQIPDDTVLHIVFIARKCAHMVAYMVLALLLWRALRKPTRNDSRPWNWREAEVVLFIVILYAASDEIHQIFVPQRTPRVFDVVIDIAGATAGLLALWILGRWRKRW